jgi:prolipoprotein diacylglyceryltransferase
MVDVDNIKSFMEKNEKTISWIAIIIGVVSVLVYGLVGIIAIILGYWIFKQKTYKTNGEIAIFLGIAGIVLSLII